MEYIIECPICGEEYARNEHIPLVLSCGHSICKVCAASLQLNFGEIACPLDKKVDLRKINEITYCYTILDLIERVIPLENKLKFLKMSPAEQKKVIQEKVKEKVSSLENAMQAHQKKIFEISDLRDKAIEDIYELFDKVKDALEERQKVLVNEVKAHTKDTLKVLQLALDEMKEYKSRLEKQSAESGNEDFFEELQKSPVGDVVKFNYKIKISDEWKELEKQLEGFGKVHLISLDFPYECRHYTGITYWVIPQCCKQYYCCNICHDLKEKHKWVFAETMVCMKCEFSQPYRKLPNCCSFCNHFHMPINLKIN